MTIIQDFKKVIKIQQMEVRMIGRLGLNHMHVTHRGMLFQRIKEVLEKPGTECGNQTTGHQSTAAEEY